MSHMTSNAIAVTGVGMVTCLGADAASSFEAMCAGCSGLKPLQHFAHDRFRTQSAYEIAEDEPGSDRPWRASELLARAVGEAIRSSAAGDPPGSLPCFVGTGLRELRSVELWWRGHA